MAQITGLKEKQLALKKIQELIRDLKPLNTFLKTDNPTNEYAVSFAGAKATILCENKEAIDNFVKAYKKSVVEKINDLAEHYSITLDEEDLSAMNDLFTTNSHKAPNVPSDI